MTRERLHEYATHFMDYPFGHGTLAVFHTLLYRYHSSFLPLYKRISARWALIIASTCTSSFQIR